MERNLGRSKGLLSQMSHHDGVFSAGEKQTGAFELSGRFTYYENGLGFKLLEVSQVVISHAVKMVFRFEANQFQNSTCFNTD